MIDSDVQLALLEMRAAQARQKDVTVIGSEGRFALSEMMLALRRPRRRAR